MRYLELGLSWRNSFTPAFNKNLRFFNSELIDIIKFLIKSFPKIKLLIYIDTTFIDYNKLKFTGKHIIESTQKNITQNTIIHTYDKFKYIFEIN